MANNYHSFETKGFHITAAQQLVSAPKPRKNFAFQPQVDGLIAVIEDKTKLVPSDFMEVSALQKELFDLAPHHFIIIRNKSADGVIVIESDDMDWVREAK